MYAKFTKQNTVYFAITPSINSLTFFSLLLGYYGACNEEEMKLALIKGGPLIVGLEVYDDFLHYKSGIYHHTGLQDRFNPLEVK